ncbi:hypothetical protein TRFO_04027 [Tritrichomonas foetus]|uniref:Uncharacterized protein n=1 Tax=Tritrichomonas foetus TaxID=1144522 RepID=A0A1J4KI94_9EUKA|nr:hypothetical protein TRFO_04027 [Tritrichomonas foetus]|eukprot:OHT11089.1 hypothetical protein TRFO_04027 [Tritrichomonas foetus]
MQFQIPITDSYAQRNKPYQPIPQQKKLPPSKINPRGWRPYRTPKGLNQNAQPVENGPNSPVLNEMLSNELNVHSNEQHRLSNDRKQVKNLNNLYISNCNEREHQARLEFFKNLIHPPSQLDIPEDPTIPALPALSLHKENTAMPITGSVFSIKEMDSIPLITNDDNAYTMRPYQV